jgi:2-aminoadipate transaminase
MCPIRRTREGHTENGIDPASKLSGMTVEQLISFARGAPSLDIVDVEGLKAAAARAFDADPAGVTAYGTSVGYLPLRKWIADKHNVSPDQVIVTNGSLQADAFLFGHLVKPGDDVVVEKPTYDRTLLNLQNLGAKVHQVTVHSDGIDTDELRALLESGVRPKLAHIIPNYQNPRTTRTWTSGSVASRCPRCCRWTPTAWSCTPPASPRRSAPASGWATWSARPR